ncbi:hypothetical protein J6590_036173 [Homalodisca vitripennis]|nr:hypothetical protein J6590_036173 [Homalodisca vitripennis]
MAKNNSHAKVRKLAKAEATKCKSPAVDQSSLDPGTPQGGKIPEAERFHSPVVSRVWKFLKDRVFRSRKTPKAKYTKNLNRIIARKCMTLLRLEDFRVEYFRDWKDSED